MTASYHRKIASHLLFTPQGFVKGAIVELDGDGVVAKITTHDTVDNIASVEFYNGILISPMTNYHCHLELSYLMGQIPERCGFQQFAQRIGEIRGNFSQEQRHKAMAYRDAKMYSEGIGKVLDICNGSSSFDIKTKSKIEYHNFMELFGLNASDCSHLDSLCSDDSRCTVTPHSTYSLNDKAFASAAKSPPLSIHFLESRDEKALFKKEGELWRWYYERGFDVDFLHHKSPTRRIIDTIGSNTKIYLIHNTFIELEDIRQLKEHFGNNVTFVLCPRSNRYLSGALPPAELLRNEGVKIALGTDSLATNTSLSLIEEMKQFDTVPLKELLSWVAAEVKIGTKGLALIENADIKNLKLTLTSTSKIL